MIQLREYQRIAVEQLTEAISRLAPMREENRLVVLEAPTGAGKTVILAAALDRAAHTAATLWLTPATGGLAEQSEAALSKHLADSTLLVEPLTKQWLATHPAIEPGTVLVSSWDRLTSTSSESGKRINILTKKNETRSLFDVLHSTAEAGTDLIIIIDESHWGTAAEGTTGLLDEINEIASGLIVEASATPKRLPDPRLMKAGLHAPVYVDLQPVIEEGMLAKQIGVNTDIDQVLGSLSEEDLAGATGESAVLTAAWQKLNQLTARYQAIASPVRPLLLVQIPDSRAGDAKLAAIEDFFADVEVNRDNGKLAVWLHKDKTPGREDIAAFDSPIRVLVFKTAVALGWDCPRAQVLVAFREMRSDIFAVQTVGRILRTPERRHYDDPILDQSYIYANIDAPTGPRSADTGRPVAVDVALARRVGELTLQGSYATRAGTFDDVKPAMFRECFAAAATATSLAARVPTSVAAVEKLLAGRTVEVSDVYDGDDQIKDTGDDTVEVAIAEHDLQAAFDAFLTEHLGGYRGKARSLPVMRQVIYDWISQNVPGWDTDHEDSDIVLAVQRLIHTPACEHLAATIDAAIARHREHDTSVSARAKATFDWTLPPKLQVSSETNAQPADASGYAYTDAGGLAWRPLPSKPEEAIEAALAKGHDDGTVLWWWKNDEGDRRFFSIAYTYPAEDGTLLNATTYPDYIAELAPTTPGRRRIAVLEGKASNDSNPLTPWKAAAIAAWRSSQTAVDVVAGVVVPLQGGLALNDGTKYTNPKPAALTDAASGWVQLDLGPLGSTKP
jgi:type III restriction enzyme